MMGRKRSGARIAKAWSIIGLMVKRGYCFGIYFAGGGKYVIEFWDVDPNRSKRVLFDRPSDLPEAVVVAARNVIAARKRLGGGQ